MSHRPDVQATLALDMRGVSKSFGAVRALDSVDLSVRAGSVHALLGENGAGKSTLMRIAYGMLPADAGEVRIFGVRPDSSVRATRAAGVGMVHQHLSLVPTLTAAENLALGDGGRFSPAQSAQRLRRLADASGLAVPAGTVVRDLSIVEQQRLEILKALGRDARLLILDEPTAVLAPREVEDLLSWIARFAAAGGAVVLVTHKLREALTVAHEMTVLRNGRVVHSGGASGASEEALASVIFAGATAQALPASPGPSGAVVVEARSVSLLDGAGVTRIRDVSFELRSGDVVGIAAVEGSGHRQLLRALAADVPVHTGLLRLPPRISVVPADRAREAIVPEFTLTENIALRGAGRRRGSMPWGSLRRQTESIVERFGILTPSVESTAAILSGGNQQRLVVGRELDGPVDLVVADNPTRGLDMRATEFVHDQLRAAAASGAVVVVHSSDLDEVLTLCSRVLVVFQGSVVEVELDRERVGRAMLGAA